MSTLVAGKVVAFVHAKGHSERLPGKNLRILGDKPLVCHAIANALACKTVDTVVIDSDEDEILRVGRKAGAVPWKRPPGLATDETTGDDLAWWQSMICPNADFLVQVVPTCPFTSPANIDKAVAALRGTISASAVGVRCASLYQHIEGRPAYRTADGRTPNSQQMNPVVWETTGLYAVSQWYAFTRRRRIADDIRYIKQSPIEAIDINTPEDWEFAEIAWRGLRSAAMATKELSDIIW